MYNIISYHKNANACQKDDLLTQIREQKKSRVDSKKTDPSRLLRTASRCSSVCCGHFTDLGHNINQPTMTHDNPPTDQ